MAKKAKKEKVRALVLSKGEKLGPRYKKKVSCSLSDVERAGKADRIVEALGETKREREAMKEATSGHRKIINELTREVENLRSQLATGAEDREVYVADRKNYREDVVETYRLDTNEMVDSRSMTKEERQEEMDLPAPGRASRKARSAPATDGEGGDAEDEADGDSPSGGVEADD